MNDFAFASRRSVEQVEEGNDLAPKFDADGVLPVVTTDAESGEVLMLGYMNAEALAKTIETGEAHYWSRSRETLWHKGATSGLVQKVVDMRIDDDQDAVWAGGGRRRFRGQLPCRLPLVLLPLNSNRKRAAARPGTGLSRK